jgi:triphosphoribosyl-dephospho-CoA synthetase
MRFLSLRAWGTRATTSSGQEIWVGASTHDTGYYIRPGVIWHAIEYDIDAERTKVGANLIVTGCVERLQLLTRSNPLTEGLTVTGATWKTDGRLLAMELKPERGC